MSVVGLERGPWRTRETFGGDELANINRYNLWPDPLLNPRTTRGSKTTRTTAVWPVIPVQTSRYVGFSVIPPA